jgi:hypothetical protein
VTCPTTILARLVSLHVSLRLGLFPSTSSCSSSSCSSYYYYYSSSSSSSSTTTPKVSSFLSAQFTHTDTVSPLPFISTNIL